MINKIIFISILISVNLFSSEIIISENFLKHPYCKNIKDVSLSSSVNSKKTFFKILKKQAKELNANTVINVSYETNIFGTHEVEGTIANCDIAKSPELFAKSSDMMAYDDEFISNVYNNKDVFVSIGVLNDSVNMKKQSSIYIANETKSSLGLDLKFGMNQNYYRYYLNINVGTGTSILGSLDYIYSIDLNNKILLGISYGMGNYQIEGSETISGVLKGLQLAYQYKNFEIGIKKLKADFSKISYDTKFTIKYNQLAYISFSF